MPTFENDTPGSPDSPSTPDHGLATKADIRRSQSKPENRPVSYQEQDRATSERSYQGQRRFGGALRQASSVSAPDLTKPTGVVLTLLALNVAWTIWRTAVTAPGHLIRSLPKAFAGIWVVGLGILIVAEFNAQLAVLFTILVTIGNVLFDNAANHRAIGALNTLFGKAG